MQFRLVIFLIIMSCSASSWGTTVEISLPSLNGAYSYPQRAGPVSFDMGVQFSSITSASIEWVATGTTGSLNLCETEISQCYTLNVPPKAEFHFEPEPGIVLSSYFDIDLGIWTRKPVEGIFGGSGSLGFDNPTDRRFLYGPKVDLLRMSHLFLDGKATFYFGTREEGTLESFAERNEMILSKLVKPTFDVTDVTITVEGTVVPIPAAFPLILSGLCVLLCFKNNVRRIS